MRFGRPPKLTPHQRQEARARLEAGETQSDIARTYNVDATTIGRTGDLSGQDCGPSIFGPPGVQERTAVWCHRDLDRWSQLVLRRIVWGLHQCAHY